MSTVRNATLPDLVALLRNQQARKIDVVAKATSIRSVNGSLRITGSEEILTDDGVTRADGIYWPTEVCDEGVAEKLKIPVGYLRRMRQERPDLFDANVNGWLHGGLQWDGESTRLENYKPDSRSFLVRCFRADDTERGIARAFLSDGYKIIDNLDVLTAVLGGVREAGVNVEVGSCDLTDRNMYAWVTCPDVTALAPALLKNYRSPFTGQTGADNPVVEAGFKVRNSEVGAGAFTITPSMRILVCKNGMTVTKDALRAVHLGGRMEDGVVKWGQDTQDRTLELVTLRARDAVKTFLSQEYMDDVIADVESRSGKPLDGPLDEAVRNVTQRLGFTSDHADGILDHFIKGGDTTAGGLFSAVTSYAQVVDDADTAHAIEGQALRVLDLV